MALRHEAYAAGMRYFKRRWGEARGDAYDHWGTSTWWFAVDANGRIVRQLEVYESGPNHLYDLEHPEDEFGGLGERFDVVELEPYEIRRSDFEEALAAHPAHNRG